MHSKLHKNLYGLEIGPETDLGKESQWAEKKSAFQVRRTLKGTSEEESASVAEFQQLVSLNLDRGRKLVRQVREKRSEQHPRKVRSLKRRGEVKLHARAFLASA